MKFRHGRIFRGAAVDAVAIFLICLAMVLPAAHAAVAAPVPIAFAGFGFSDSSGEAQDQQAVHAARLRRLQEDVAAGLAKSGKFRVVALSCKTEDCGATDTEAADLAAEAKTAGADLLLIGGIHKMSTLIMWMKVDVVEVKSGKTVLDKLITFRGDNDEAWTRAGEFLLRQLDEMQK